MFEVPWSTFFIAIYAYLGIVVGQLLIKIAPEEIKPGRRYFHYAHIFLMLFLLLFIYFFGLINIDIYFFVLAFIGIILGIFEANIFLFLSIGMVVFLNELAIVFGAIVFVQGMISTVIDQNNKAFFYNSLYYFVPLILLFVVIAFRTIATRYGMPLIFGGFLACLPQFLSSMGMNRERR